MSNFQLSARMKTLYMIFGALLTGQLIFALVVTIVPQPPSGNAANIHSMMMYVAPAIVLMGYILGNLMFKLMIGPAKHISEEAGKFQKYTSACIMKWAAQEGPNLLILVIFMITGETYYLYILGGGIALFLTSYPSPAQYENQTR